MKKILTLVFSVLLFATCSSKKEIPTTYKSKKVTVNHESNTAAQEPITDPKLTEVWEPEPLVVDPGKTPNSPPSDAIILFDGNNLDEWVHYDDSPAKWTVENDILTCKPGTGDIKTKKIFGDVQLRLEWRSPNEPNKTGQDLSLIHI